MSTIYSKQVLWASLWIFCLHQLVLLKQKVELCFHSSGKWTYSSCTLVFGHCLPPAIFNPVCLADSPLLGKEKKTAWWCSLWACFLSSLPSLCLLIHILLTCLYTTSEENIVLLVLSTFFCLTAWWRLVQRDGPVRCRRASLSHRGPWQSRGLPVDFSPWLTFPCVCLGFHHGSVQTSASNW